MSPKSIAVVLIDALLRVIFPLRAARKGALEEIAKTRILIVRTDHIGDVYLSIPSMIALRERYPNARLTVLVASWAKPLLDGLGIADEILTCDPPWWVKTRRSRFGHSSGQGSWRALWETLKQLRQRQFDLCIELRGDVRQILAFGVLSGAKTILTRPRNGGAILADCAPLIDDTQHECEQNMQLLKALGISLSPPAFPLPYTPEERANSQRIMTEMLSGDTRKTVVIHPGAKWVNRWPTEHYAQLIVLLTTAQNAVNIFLTGAASEVSLCEELALASPEHTHVLAGRLSLRETAAAMAAADLVIMADTGPMHFLNAIETKALLMFGPTPVARFAPRFPHISVLGANHCCSVALHETCTRVAPGCHSACMAEISVQDAHAAIKRLLGQHH